MKNTNFYKKYPVFEATIEDSKFESDGNYKIFDKEIHKKAKQKFKADKKDPNNNGEDLDGFPDNFDVGDIESPLKDKFKERFNTVYSGSFGLHVDEELYPGDKSQHHQAVVFHSIHKDHRFLTTDPDGSFKVHSEFDEPIEFDANLTHGLIHKDFLKDAINGGPRKFANRDGYKDRDPDVVSAVFSVSSMAEGRGKI